MLMLVLAAALATTILSGGAVAGLRAGTIFNTFPLMGGELIPSSYAMVPGWWANAFENPVAAQFHHRMLAILTGLAALVIAWRAHRAALAPPIARAIVLVGGVVLIQVTLGVLTLLFAVPITLGVLHQLVGVLALSATVLAVHRATYG
jgi:cytochrome c oxidase assembly protein subunit 15